MALPFPEIDPIALSIGPVVVRWYALAYIAGFILGWIYCKKIIALYAPNIIQSNTKQPNTRQPNIRQKDKKTAPLITTDQIDIALNWAIIGVILGGRIGYVLFYNLQYYIDDPSNIYKVWQGGMSFHGGLLGAGLAMYLCARKHHMPWRHLFDLAAAATPIGLFFGRIANFINAELYGRPTDLPWGIIFPSTPDSLPRHPSQLYEAALEGLVLFAILYVAIRFKDGLNKPGLILGIFLASYGIFRMVIEFARSPDPQIGYIANAITMGQILCLPMIFLGGYFIYQSNKLSPYASSSGSSDSRDASPNDNAQKS